MSLKFVAGGVRWVLEEDGIGDECGCDITTLQFLCVPQYFYPPPMCLVGTSGCSVIKTFVTFPLTPLYTYIFYLFT